MGANEGWEWYHPTAISPHSSKASKACISLKGSISHLFVYLFIKFLSYKKSKIKILPGHEYFLNYKGMRFELLKVFFLHQTFPQENQWLQFQVNEHGNQLTACFF